MAYFVQEETLVVKDVHTFPFLTFRIGVKFFVLSQNSVGRQMKEGDRKPLWLRSSVVRACD